MILFGLWQRGVFNVCPKNDSITLTMKKLNELFLGRAYAYVIAHNETIKIFLSWVIKTTACYRHRCFHLPQHGREIITNGRLNFN